MNYRMSWLVAVSMFVSLNSNGVAEAWENCSDGAGDCCTGGSLPGCNDGGSGCCARVCACDPFCCEMEWDDLCAGNGAHNAGCGAAALCPECVDSDGDGVSDDIDVCCMTPPDTAVDDEGRPLGDFDRDCDYDLDDFRSMSLGFSGATQAHGQCDAGPCIRDLDCDDSNACTTGQCVNGVCQYSTIGCDDDGNACTLEACNPNTGSCEVVNVMCPAGEACNPLSGKCEMSGACYQRLTAGPDTLSCGSGDDYFDATLVTESGELIQTLNNGDSLFGGDGVDQLTIETFGGVLSPAELSDIEILTIENVGQSVATLSLATSNGFDVIRNRGVRADSAHVVIREIPTAPTLVEWTDGAGLFELRFGDDVLAGDSDACRIVLRDVFDPGDQDPEMRFDGGQGGFELFQVESIGLERNDIKQITTASSIDGAPALTISGPADLTIRELWPYVKSVDATAAQGDLVISVDSFLVNTDFWGGAGDDTIDFSARDGSFDTGDRVIGGPGFDKLLLTGPDAQMVYPLAGVFDVEAIEITTDLTGDIDLQRLRTDKLIASARIGGQTVHIPDNGRLEVNVDPEGDACVKVNPATGSGKLGLEMNADWTGDCLLKDWSHVDISVNETSVVFHGGLTMESSESFYSLALVGAHDITFTGVVDAVFVDGRGIEGRVIMLSKSNAALLNGGDGDDILQGSQGSDVITGGSGADVIRGYEGADVLVGDSQAADAGDGADLFVFESDAIENGNDSISDFAENDRLDFSRFATDSFVAGPVTTNGGSRQLVDNNDIWLLHDKVGSIETPEDIAALFGSPGSPFSNGTPGMHVVLIVQDLRDNGDTTVWYVDEGDENGTVSSGECVRVCTMQGYNGPFTNANIAN